jgi:uncharacterized HhH-GPD family protein
MSSVDVLHFTDDPEANRYLARDPLALLMGMLLDQQVPMEWAFKSPYLLRQRLGGDGLDAAAIAALDPDELAATFSRKPALHRFPGSMAKRVHQLCQILVDEYGGDAARVWGDAASGEELYERVRGLPGFGEEKARVFMALLGKRLGVQPEGWDRWAADWPTIADVAAPADIATVREAKRARKAAGKTSSLSRK